MYLLLRSPETKLAGYAPVTNLVLVRSLIALAQHHHFLTIVLKDMDGSALCDCVHYFNILYGGTEYISDSVEGISSSYFPSSPVTPDH
jgi:hypothetical protein